MHVFLKRISIGKTEWRFFLSPSVNVESFKSVILLFGGEWKGSCDLSNSEASDLSLGDLRTPSKREESGSQCHRLSASSYVQLSKAEASLINALPLT